MVVYKGFSSPNFLIYGKSWVCGSPAEKTETTFKGKTWNEVIRNDLKERKVSKYIAKDRNAKGLKGIWNSTRSPLNAVRLLRFCRYCMHCPF